MSELFPQMSGMPQTVEMVPTEAELEAAAAVKTRKNIGPNKVIISPSVGEVIAPERALADNNIIRLSKNMKLRMAHRGFTEIEQLWKTYDTYEEVTAGSTTTWQFVPKEERPSLVIADTDDGIVWTNFGTFTRTTGYKTTDYDGDDLIPFADDIYNGNASSSSANDGLVGPTVLALAADNVLKRTTIMDHPGRTGGEAMDADNYLTQPGDPVVTSQTAKYSLDFALSLIGTDVSSYTDQELCAILVAAGVPVNSVVSDNASYAVFGYKAQILVQTDPPTELTTADITTLESLTQLIVDCNTYIASL